MTLEQIVAELRRINDAANGRELTTAEQTRWDELTRQAETIKAASTRAAAVEALSATAPKAGANRMTSGDCCTPPGYTATPQNGQRWRTPDGRELRSYGAQDSMAEGTRAALVERGIDPGELSLGAILRAKMTSDYRNLTDGEAKLLRGDMTEGSNTSGGFLVPEVLSAMWWDLPRAQSVLLRAGAQRVPMTSDRMAIARVITDPTHETKAELAAFSGSAPKVGSIGLTAHTFGQVVNVSEELLMDAPNCSQIIETTLAMSLATQIDSWFLKGTGSAEPTGLLLNEDLSTAAAATDWDGLMLGMTQAEEAHGEPTAWIVSPGDYNAMRSTRVDSGDGAYLLPPDDVKALKRLVSGQISDGTVLVGDFSSVVLGVRMDPRIEVSNTAGDSFETFARKIRIVGRMDIATGIPAHICKCS